MSIDIINRCCICEADFRPEGLDKEGKCISCRIAYPTVKSKTEAMALNQPELRLGEKLDASKVRQIVREELNAIEAERKAEALKVSKDKKETK